VAHLVIDGLIAPRSDERPSCDEPLLDPNRIADAYWYLASQKRSAWTLDLDLRPHDEQFYV
jgi:hypothetical protein